MVHAESSMLYPSLTPAERNTPRYWWRYTVSYWVSTLFMIGSVLFVVGASFDYLDDELPLRLNAIQKSATVHWPYFVGGIFFIAGSYLGYFAAINLGRREDLAPRYVLYVSLGDLLPWRMTLGYRGDSPNASPREREDDRTVLLPAPPKLDIVPEARHSFFGYLAYLVGASAFQVGILIEILEARHALNDHTRRRSAHGYLSRDAFTAWPGILGGVLFVVGAAFAVDVNSSWRLSGATTDIAWWVSNVNMFGSILFLEAGVFSLHGTPAAIGATVSSVVKLPYLIGSLCFLVAATLDLFMWRIELHGLSFVRAINKSSKLTDLLREIDVQNPVESVADSDGNNSSISLNQLCFVLVVILTYAFSLMDLVFANRLSFCRGSIHYAFLGSAYDVYDSALQSVLCFAALALASVVHTVPKQRPFGMLTWILRISMFLLLIRYGWKFVISWHDSQHAC